MEIQEIKQQLTLSEVIKHYGLKADKQNRVLCPFHNDTNPSLQLYYKTHTAFCFSSNCKTHGKAIDVIDFVMYYENCTKHEALQKCTEILGGSPVATKIQHSNTVTPKPYTVNQTQNFLTNMFTYFKNAVHNSKPSQEYIQSRFLDFKKTEVGYNAGQFHHGTRKDETLIQTCIEYGLLLDLGLKARTGDTAYKPFGKWCIVFPLKNKQNQIVSLYFRSTLANKDQRHFYLKNRHGLYPNYPSAETKKLILTESIIDAATLLEQKNIQENYSVLALFGTNGLTEEHTEAVSQLKQLNEIVFFLNGDEPGIKAVEKYAPMLKAEYPNIQITSVAVPQNEDVNSLLQGHSPEILTHLIETRKEYSFLFSSENQVKEKIAEVIPQQEPEQQKINISGDSPQPQAIGLDTNNPYNLKYTGSEAHYSIKGFNIQQLDSLKVTLQITVK
jgi:DNA primase catalytic core